MSPNLPCKRGDVVLDIGSATGRASGLLGDSVVMAGNVATVSLLAIDRVIGSAPMPAIDDALRHTFAL